MFRQIMIIGEHTRECLGGTVERSITGEHLIGELDRLAAQRGSYPAVLRCDNGPELACAAMADWASGQVGLDFIPPGEPWRNGYVESCNSRIRDECLNINSFWSAAQPRVVTQTTLVRRGPVHGVRPRPLGAAARTVLCYPPWGGRGITACRNPYFTTYPLPRRPAPAPRPALPAIGTPLSIPFDCGATERAALASWTSSIAAGVDPCQPAGTDSRPRVLASPIWADTLLAVNGAPLTPAVPPMGGSAAPGTANPSPFSSAVA